MNNYNDEFLENFYELLEDTDRNEITLDTNYKNLVEWDSMVALTVIAMVDEKYGKKITGNDFKTSETLGDLAALLNKK